MTETPPDSDDAMAKVSVIMPAYNAESTLGVSMASVLEQDYRDLELVVIDDSSSDATWSLVEAAAASDSRVVPIQLSRNSGVAAARNAGLDAATGTHIAFLDSDDCWLPGKLTTQLADLRRTGALISYAAYRRVDERGRVLSVVRPPAQVNHRDMLKSNHIGNLTSLYHRSIDGTRFRRVGHEDYVFWLEMVRRAGTAQRVPTNEPLAEYLVRASSLSADKRAAARWQWSILRNIVGLDPVRSTWYFAHYAANAVLKRR